MLSHLLTLTSDCSSWNVFLCFCVSQFLSFLLCAFFLYLLLSLALLERLGSGDLSLALQEDLEDKRSDHSHKSVLSEIVHVLLC